jgi:hypothetical protein
MRYHDYLIALGKSQSPHPKSYQKALKRSTRQPPDGRAPSWKAGLMLYWIYDYPSWVMGALFGAAFVAAALFGIFVLRPFIRSRIHTERRANDMVGLTLSSFSVLYAFLLGLLALASFQNFTVVGDLVTKEASSMAALYRDFGGYPEPIRGQLREILKTYTHDVITDSWPKQQRGIVPRLGSEDFATLVDHMQAFEPEKKSQEIIHAEALRQLDNLIELRRARLSNVSAGIPPVFWWVVAIGALLNILLIWMLDMDVYVHSLLGGSLALFLGVVIFMIAALDHPFRGEVSIEPDAIQQVYDTLMNAPHATNH